jgi:hypothetical protein
MHITVRKVFQIQPGIYPVCKSYKLRDVAEGPAEYLPRVTSGQHPEGIRVEV